MNLENFSIDIAGKGKVAGTAHGSGERLLLCWHGYGQDRRLFQFLAALAPAGCRVVCIDMPPFGESAWPDEGRPILPGDLDAFLQALLRRFPCESVEVVAFSLGAKLALGLYGATQVPIRRMVLISPDGLRIHPIYRFCIYNPVGKALFYTVLRWPALFLFLLRALYHLRITDPFKYRFVKMQFEAPHRRVLLRRVWRGNAQVRPDIAAIAGRSADIGTEWHVFWGREDNILPLNFCEGFIQKVKGATLHTVDGGHFLLNPPHPDVVQRLKSILEL